MEVDRIGNACILELRVILILEREIRRNEVVQAWDRKDYLRAGMDSLGPICSSAVCSSEQS